MLSRTHLAAALFSATILASAPAYAAEEDSQLWGTLNATIKLSDRFRLSEEATARFSDNRNGLYEIEVNSLLGYKLSDKVTAWAGYTHNPQYAGGDFTVMEHRLREQVTVDNIAQIGRGKVNARLRAEQRWRNGVDGTGWRVRPYLKYSLPLKKGGKTALVLSHESFLNLNSTPFQKQTGYDRMRNLIGISTPLGKAVTAEVGYLNQYGVVRGGPDRMDHAASITLSASL
jgi:hypothetical protein